MKFNKISTLKRKISKFDPINYLANKDGEVQTWEMRVLDKVLANRIPFNKPLGIKFQSIVPGKVEVLLPNRRSNWNHLKGIHATAIATAGEFVSGMALLTKASMNDYRYIMSELKINYLYQGRLDLVAKCELPDEEIKQFLLDLSESGKQTFKTLAVLTDSNGEKVATVEALWQLKSWDKVTSKS
jgi:acyl-coenzyme A thioesterase PaaI-like protein